MDCITRTDNAYAETREAMLLIETACAYEPTEDYAVMFHMDMQAAERHLELAVNEHTLAMARAYIHEDTAENHAMVNALRLAIAVAQEFHTDMLRNRTFVMDINATIDGIIADLDAAFDDAAHALIMQEPHMLPNEPCETVFDTTPLDAFVF